MFDVSLFIIKRFIHDEAKKEKTILSDG